MSNQPVTVGSSAPDFSLQSGDGSEIKLSEQFGRSNTVMYFVRDFT